MVGKGENTALIFNNLYKFRWTICLVHPIIFPIFPGLQTSSSYIFSTQLTISHFYTSHALAKGSLTHYQTTNFRLFQTERVCRRPFQIWRKWQKVIQMGRKHSGKRRNCMLQAVFSKGLFPRGVKRCDCVGMGYPFPKQALVFMCLQQVFWK